VSTVRLGAGADRFGNFNFDIWIMKEYGVAQSWMPLLQLFLPSITVGPPLGLSIICYAKKGEDKVLLLKQDTHGFVYHLRHQSYSVCRFHKLFREITSGYETLISPNFEF